MDKLISANRLLSLYEGLEGKCYVVSVDVAIQNIKDQPAVEIIEDSEEPDDWDLK